MLDSPDACLAYAFGDQGDDISNDDLQGASLGLPAMMNGLMRVTFDEDSPLHRPSTNSTAKNNLTSPLACWDPSDLCKKETVEAGGITGGTALDCINDAALHCGESKLEDLACAYIAEGAAETICKSKYYGWAKSWVNKVINKHIEEPIVHAATSFEEGCLHAAESVGGFFGSFF
jgi:hypothetical protein